MSAAVHAPRDLWGAAAADDVEALRSLVGQGGGELDKDNLDLNVDERDDHGRTALHAAASAGAETAVRFLLARGANPNKADWESHWTALHRALYHGHLRIALLLLRAGAVLGDELTPWRGAGHVRGSNNDKKGSNGSRKDGVDKDGLTPLSLLSWRLRAHLQQAVREGRGGDVVTFGKTDFPLGYALPNTRDVQKPRRVESLADIEVVTVAAAKHHSVVLDVQGRVFTWGHGRGGRLGHGDEHPQMFPKLVSQLVGLRVVKVAAAENHTVCVTDQGLVFSWGSDRFGQLGLGNGGGSSSAAAATGGQGRGQGQGSTRLVPRRIEALRRCMVADVSAGATHTVAVTREGEVYTWGGNKSGQLGYEGVGAAGDGMPRMVSLLYHRANGKDPRRAIQVSAGCRCTLVVVEGGSGRHGPNKVYQFGYGSHVPLRVAFRPAEKAQREVGKRRSSSFSGSSSSSSSSKSNSWAAQDGTRGGARINVVQVSAGRHHNVALASTGLVYTWGLGADQLGLGVGGGEEEGGGGGVTHTTCPRVVQGMGQDRGVFVSASAGHTCVVSETGDLYSWGSTDGQQGILGHGQGSWQPVPKRVVGLKRGIKVAAGPEHTVVLLSASSPALPHPHADLKEVQARLAAAVNGRASDDDEDEYEGESRSPSPFSVGNSSEGDEDLFVIDDVEALMPLFHGGGHDKKKSNKGVLTSSLPALVVLPTLKELCERAIAVQVDMRNAISVLAHAEALDSRELAGYCVEFVQRNFDGILVAGRPADLDFLLEDAADDVNTLFQEASSSSSSFAAAAAAAAAEEAAAAAAAAARPSPVATMLARVQRGQDPTLEEALRLERGLKKRLTQVEELARLEAGGMVLSVDQVRKMSRRSILESEAEKLLPLLARLRVIDKAREVREKERERAAAEAEAAAAAAAAAVAGEEEKDGDLKHDQLKSTEEKAFSLLYSLSSSPSSSASLLPTTYTCDACHVTCANEGIWQDHLKGKRHSKRLAKVQAEAAVIQAALEQAAKEAREKDMWQRGMTLPPPPTPASPWSAGSVAPSTPTSNMRPSPMSEHRRPLPTTPSSLSSSPPSSNKKSFREILEEEEGRSAAAAAAAATKGGLARGMSMSGSSSNSSSSSNPFGKSPGLAVGSPPGHARRSNSISSISSNSSTLLQPLSSSMGTGTGGGGGEGTVLLSAYLKTTTTTPRPVVPALSSTSSWAANGGGGSNGKSGSTSSSSGSSSGSSSKQAAAVKAVVSSVASLDLASSPPAVRSSSGGAGAATGGATPSFESIMAEEERMAALVRFDGNNCPWLSGRRERSDSFEVIQKQQRELESLKEEEEFRAMAEALAVAAAEEEKERQEEEDRWFRKQIQQQQQQQRRRSAYLTSPSSSSKPSFSSTSSSSSKKKKNKPQQGGPTTTEATAGAVPVVEGESLQTPKKKNYNAGGNGSGSRGGKPRQPQSSPATSSFRGGNGGSHNSTGDKGAAAGSSEKKWRGAPFRPAAASPAAATTAPLPPPPKL